MAAFLPSKNQLSRQLADKKKSNKHPKILEHLTLASTPWSHRASSPTLMMENFRGNPKIEGRAGEDVSLCVPYGERIGVTWQGKQVSSQCLRPPAPYLWLITNSQSDRRAFFHSQSDWCMSTVFATIMYIRRSARVHWCDSCCCFPASAVWFSSCDCSCVSSLVGLAPLPATLSLDLFQVLHNSGHLIHCLLKNG